MKTLNRSEIQPIKMSTNPPEEVVNCGNRIINTDGYIYHYVGIGWVQEEKAQKKDYLEIPRLIDEPKNKTMKDILKEMLLMLIAIIVTYLVYSFVIGNLDVFEWTEAQRFLMVVNTIVFYLLICFRLKIQ